MTDKKKTPGKMPKQNNKAPKKRPEDSGLMLSALKNFGIIFVSCLLIFGLAASFAVTLITATVDDILKDEQSELDSILNAQPDDAQTSTGDDDFEIPSGESFTSLFVVTDYNPDYFTYYPKEEALDKLKADRSSRDMGVLGAGYKTVKARYIVIIRADKESREYTITPLASCTRVYTSMGYKLLADVYSAFGPEYFVKKVTALTGISIDYYYFMNITEASDIIKELGTFTVDLATDIYSDGASYGTQSGAYDSVTAVTPPPEFTETEAETETETETTEAETDENGDVVTKEGEKKELSTYSVVVRAGTVNVTESNIKALLMFENYKNGIAERCDLQYQIAKGALARLASMPENDMLALFAKVCAYADYDEFTDELYDDGFINTNMDAPVFAKKTALIAAYLKFTITDLEFPGKFVADHFVPSLTDGTTLMADYKLPPDPEKE